LTSLAKAEFPVLCTVSLLCTVRPALLKAGTAGQCWAQATSHSGDSTPNTEGRIPDHRPARKDEETPGDGIERIGTGSNGSKGTLYYSESKTYSKSRPLCLEFSLGEKFGGVVLFSGWSPREQLQQLRRSCAFWKKVVTEPHSRRLVSSHPSQGVRFLVSPFN
jgi:hypothetical protein